MASIGARTNCAKPGSENANARKNFFDYTASGLMTDFETRRYNRWARTISQYSGSTPNLSPKVKLSVLARSLLSPWITYQAERARPASAASGSKILLKPVVRHQPQLLCAQISELRAGEGWQTFPAQSPPAIFHGPHQSEPNRPDSRWRRPLDKPWCALSKTPS